MKGEFSHFIFILSICLNFKNNEYWICFNFIMEKNLKELSRINFDKIHGEKTPLQLLNSHDLHLLL